MGTFDEIVFKPLVQVALTAAVAGPVAWVTSRVSAKVAQRAEFRSRLQQIIQLSIQHPHLEHKPFRDGWNSREPEDFKYWQYDNYCCLIFNLIEDIFRYYNGDKKRMEEVLHIREWVLCHEVWWKANEAQNCNGYSAKFWTLINNIIAEG